MCWLDTGPAVGKAPIAIQTPRRSVGSEPGAANIDLVESSLFGPWGGLRTADVRIMVEMTGCTRVDAFE